MLYGEGLKDVQIWAIDEEYKPIVDIKLNIQIRTNNFLKFKIDNSYKKRDTYTLNLQIKIDDSESIYLLNNYLLNNYLANNYNINTIDIMYAKK